MYLIFMHFFYNQNLARPYLYIYIYIYDIYVHRGLYIYKIHIIHAINETRLLKQLKQVCGIINVQMIYILITENYKMYMYVSLRGHSLIFKHLK